MWEKPPKRDKPLPGELPDPGFNGPLSEPGSADDDIRNGRLRTFGSVDEMLDDLHGPYGP